MERLLAIPPGRELGDGEVREIMEMSRDVGGLYLDPYKGADWSLEGRDTYTTMSLTEQVALEARTRRAIEERARTDVNYKQAKLDPVRERAEVEARLWRDTHAGSSHVPFVHAPFPENFYEPKGDGRRFGQDPEEEAWVDAFTMRRLAELPTFGLLNESAQVLRSRFTGIVPAADVLEVFPSGVGLPRHYGRFTTLALRRGPVHLAMFSWTIDPNGRTYVALVAPVDNWRDDMEGKNPFSIHAVAKLRLVAKFAHFYFTCTCGSEP